MTSIEWLMERVERTHSCWLWTGYVTPAGYGQASIRGRHIYAHRLSFELFRGPVPRGMHLDHLCCRKPCANPLHLEAVMPGMNLSRGRTGAVGNPQTAKTTCPQGHPYDAQNTYGARICTRCRRSADRRYWANKHSEVASG